MKPVSTLPVLAGLASPLLVGAAAPQTAAPASCTGPASATRLYVNVQNIQSSDGLIAVTLYADDSSRFLARRGALYVGRVPAHSPSTRVCIHLPRPGTYALAIYHDADANRSFNRTGVGLPAEGYGFSNNASTMFGLPSFSAVRLAIPRTNMQTTVRLRYP
jgi:uncharacterized protein (DUF2141 family)